MVTTTIDRKIYTGNGVTDSFATGYKFIENDDLEVYLQLSGGSDTLQTITTHYTVTGAGDDSGGTVTFITPPPSSSTVTLKRKTDLTQLVDYIKNDNFPAETHEGALDKLTLMLQEAYAAISDATNGTDPNGLILKYPVSEPTTTSNLIPDKATRTSTTFIWDSNGEPAAGSGTTGVLNNASDMGGGSPSVTDGATQNAIQDYAVARPASTVDENIARFNGTSGQIEDSGFGIIDEDSMASDSATDVPTQQSTKAYVDTQIAAIPDSEITGVIKDYVGTTAPTGYVLANGLTIGNASSGGTGRANADTEDLFTLLWDSTADTELPIQDSSGTPVGSRGASAAADFAADRRLPLPDLRGRLIAGLDDMGTSDAALIGSTTNVENVGAGTNANTVPAREYSINVGAGGSTGRDGLIQGNQLAGLEGWLGDSFASSAASIVQYSTVMSKIIKL